MRDQLVWVVEKRTLPEIFAAGVGVALIAASAFAGLMTLFSMLTN